MARYLLKFFDLAQDSTKQRSIASIKGDDNRLALVVRVFDKVGRFIDSAV
jgi:hypothetical protein